jgi:hypothetical protein
MNHGVPLIGGALVLALVLATSCRQHRTREFVAVQRPVEFENWRLYVNAQVDAANSGPTNHFFVISTVAWTAPGDAIGGPASEFRPTAYDASLDSLRLFCVEGTNEVEMQLPPLDLGSSDHPNRLVQLAPTNGARIEIPASVSKLRADVTMTFRHRDTDKAETRVFSTALRRREGTKLAPMLE